MNKVIDFQKKKREKLASYKSLSESQRYLKKEGFLASKKPQSSKTKELKTQVMGISREELLVEFYTLETIYKLRNIYFNLSIACSLVSVSLVVLCFIMPLSLVELAFMLFSAFAFFYLSCLFAVKAIGEHYFKMRFQALLSDSENELYQDQLDLEEIDHLTREHLDTAK